MSSRSHLPSLAILLLSAGFSWAQFPGAPTDIPPAPVETPALAASVFPNCFCDCNAQCGQLNRVWARAEYLLWWMKGSPLPASMVIDSTGFTITDLQTGAIFNKPSLIGNELGGNARSGGRFGAGFWFDRTQTVGVEGSYFFLGDQTNGRDASVGPGATLGSPVSVSFSPPGATIPGSGVFSLGGVDTSASARVEIASALRGADLNGVLNLFRGTNLRLDLLGGFRWFQLQETLTYQAASNTAVFAGSGAQGVGSFTLVDTNVSTTSPLTFSDRFATNNNFNGGQIGARADYTAGNWFGNITGKVAFGNMQQTIDVTGSNTAFNNPVFSILNNGGIYAQPSNIGHHAQDIFAVASEVSANVGWQPRSWLRTSVGYTFFYVNKVVRPGNQLQNTIDVTPAFTGAPGTVPSSATLFKESTFWAQGLNFSLEFRY